MDSFEPKTRRQRRKAAADGLRPWSDLPPELLSLIANRLGLIALLAFRGTCKTWRSATSEDSALCECELDKDPSFIVCDEQAKTCSFYCRSDGSGAQFIYNTLNIPVLENANCLASDQGWLLLHSQGSLFFFCPFSRARIDLPVCPDQSDLSSHVAAFSAPPTSPECIVALTNPSSQAESALKLHIIRRGESQWAHQETGYGEYLKGLSAAVYVEAKGSFYFMAEDRLLRFSVVDKGWTPYKIVEDGDTPQGAETLPFDYQENFFSQCKMNEVMGIEDDASISICGTTLPGENCVTYVCNEKVEAQCGTAASNLKGIWIQPRFIQIPENQGWNL